MIGFVDKTPLLFMTLIGLETGLTTLMAFRSTIEPLTREPVYLLVGAWVLAMLDVTGTGNGRVFDLDLSFFTLLFCVVVVSLLVEFDLVGANGTGAGGTIFDMKGCSSLPLRTFLPDKISNTLSAIIKSSYSEVILLISSFSTITLTSALAITADTFDSNIDVVADDPTILFNDSSDGLVWAVGGASNCVKVRVGLFVGLLDTRLQSSSFSLSIMMIELRLSLRLSLVLIPFSCFIFLILFCWYSKLLAGMDRRDLFFIVFE